MPHLVTIDDLEVPALWLRDACACAECRHPGSGQRLRSVLSLDPAIRVESLTVSGDSVEAMFAPDGHAGSYSLAWLQANAPGRADVFDDRSERTRRPWVAADLGDGPPHVTWDELNACGPARAEAMRELMALGLLLVRGVPARPSTLRAPSGSCEPRTTEISSTCASSHSRSTSPTPAGR